MKPRGRLLASALLVFTLVVVVLCIPGLVDTWDVENDNEWSFRGFGLVIAVVFALAGALITFKRPDNAVGWLFCGAGAEFAVTTAAEVYAVLPLIDGRSGGLLYPLAWFSSWAWVIGLGLIAFAILLFPTGHLPGPRWIRPARVMVLAWVLAGFSFAFAPGPLNNIPFVNRYAFPAGPVTELFVEVGGLALMAALVGSAIAVVQRYRASQGLERQQMKLFALTAAGQPLAIGLVLVAEILAPVLMETAAALQGAVTASIPIAMAIAILRYRLYDIDVILNRALVYGVLSGLLALIYLGAVVLFQQVLSPITVESDLAIAGSTLAVAALFRPLRERVQAFIDRRFYRRRYDAAETLGAFSARLRDQVDLNSLSREVIEVVGTTMQPAHASLWLRAGADL